MDGWERPEMSNEAALLQKLLEQAEHQTQALGRIANTLEAMFSRVCKEIDEAKTIDGN